MPLQLGRCSDTQVSAGEGQDWQQEHLVQLLQKEHSVLKEDQHKQLQEYFTIFHSELNKHQELLQADTIKLDAERREFLLHRVHAADADVMRREQDLLAQSKDLEVSKCKLAAERQVLDDQRNALREGQEKLTMEQAELVREKLLLEESKRHLESREEFVAERELAEQESSRAVAFELPASQSEELFTSSHRGRSSRAQTSQLLRTSSLAAALDPTLSAWPWVAARRSTGMHAHRRFRSWFVGLLMVALAVYASRRHLSPWASPLWPMACRAVGDHIQCFPPLAGHRR